MGCRRSVSTWESRSPSDRKSTRLNSSHSQISYAVFCLKKKKPHDRRFDDVYEARDLCHFVDGYRVVLVLQMLHDDGADDPPHRDYIHHPVPPSTFSL